MCGGGGMEAGYDFLLIHERLKRRIASFTGIFLLVFGIILLASGGAYYAYSANAKSNLNDLAVITSLRAVNTITSATAADAHG